MGVFGKRSRQKDSMFKGPGKRPGLVGLRKSKPTNATRVSRERGVVKAGL